MNLKFQEFKKINTSSEELDIIRSKSFKNFENKGFPTKLQEHWKYTDLKNLIYKNFKELQIFYDKKNLTYDKNFLIKNFDYNKIVLLNGNVVEYDINFEDKSKVSIKPLKKVFKNKKDFEKIKEYFEDDQNSLISLNHALVNDGIFLDIAENYFFNKPLVIYNIFDQKVANKIINSKFFISLGAGSNLSLIDLYKSKTNVKYFNNVTHNYIVKRNAILKKFNVNDNPDDSFNYNSTKVKSFSNSIFENFVLSLGPSFIKNEIHCDLLETHASCFLNGIMFLNKNQHHELKTNINHRYANCKSSQLVKSVLLDNSNGTYQGKIYVDKSAQKTNGYQLSKALILSENSEFNSKPELEIYADDVKCSHGSTSGNIDEDSIFYLMSRGLTKNQANEMIIEGFLNEVIETITEFKIKILIRELLRERFKEISVL